MTATELNGNILISGTPTDNVVVPNAWTNIATINIPKGAWLVMAHACLSVSDKGHACALRFSDIDRSEARFDCGYGGGACIATKAITTSAKTVNLQAYYYGSMSNATATQVSLDAIRLGGGS